MKRAMIALVISIPATSVLLGILMIVLAVNTPDSDLEVDEQPLNKTSWREEQ